MQPKKTGVSKKVSLAYTRGISLKGLPGDKTETGKLHRFLLSIMPRLDTDFEPYGKRSRIEGDTIPMDCSCQCKHFQPLKSMPFDWGVCTNKKSPRCGLLTFEHQGCSEYEQA